MTLQWVPLPRKPWRVYDDEGHLLRRFDTAEQAAEWIRKQEAKP